MTNQNCYFYSTIAEFLKTSKETLHSVDWLPADQLILDKIEELL